MQRLYLFTLFTILAMLLVACGPAIGAGAVQLPAAQEQTNLAAEVVAPNSGDAAGVTKAPAGECPVTQPPARPFTPPAPYPPTSPYPGEFWYGTEALWTLLPEDGTWRALPFSESGYTQKVFWWREGYNWLAEPEPALAVAGRRLDEDAPPLVAPAATNGFHEVLQSFMLVGMDVPTAGCWEITGRIDEQELSFVVLVRP
ncbi:MAG: hypothetical protein L0332_06520 [Chloroflexi bacterium]|nr:hypothetical protein [Chloroflexota bacterium]MCI0575833.1 hypothetical protein [Chloroflexota bacterium]MCI0646560.1 hypothetical protein [Chloroflexota bacterium]MCI0726362.1 hypothetical protein [Chloroflexota bacterium]